MRTTQEMREYQQRRRATLKKLTLPTPVSIDEPFDFDENLLRVGRVIPQCPFGKWAFEPFTAKRNGIRNYGYYI